MEKIYIEKNENKSRKRIDKRTVLKLTQVDKKRIQR